MDSVKRKAVVIVSLATVLVMQLILFFTVGREYGYSEMTATAQSISVFSHVPSWMKLWHVGAVWIFIRYGILLVSGQIALALFQKFLGKRHAISIGAKSIAK